MKGHLIDAVFHRAKAGFRRVSGSIHLVRQLLNQLSAEVTEQRQLVQD
jgi:hypothetical protein